MTPIKGKINRWTNSTEKQSLAPILKYRGYPKLKINVFMEFKELTRIEYKNPPFHNIQFP